MSRHLVRPVAVLLCCLLASPAVSLSAAERAAVLGRIVAAPPAQVNGVALPADATLLAGDRLATRAPRPAPGPRGGAPVLLARGEQIHLAALSDARALRQGENLTVELNQGRVTLRTHGSDLRVRSNGLEIMPTTDNAVWEVARLREGLTQVASLQGSVAVRSANQSVAVLPGQSFQLQTRLLESAQEPTGTDSGAGMRAGTKLAIVLAILAGSAIGIAIPLSRGDNHVVSPSVP